MQTTYNGAWNRGKKQTSIRASQHFSPSPLPYAAYLESVRITDAPAQPRRRHHLAGPCIETPVKNKRTRVVRILGARLSFLLYGCHLHAASAEAATTLQQRPTLRRVKLSTTGASSLCSCRHSCLVGLGWSCRRIWVLGRRSACGRKGRCRLARRLKRRYVA